MYVVTLVSLVIELACRKQATSASFHRHFFSHQRIPSAKATTMFVPVVWSHIFYRGGFDVGLRSSKMEEMQDVLLSVSLTLKIIHFWFLVSLAIFPFQIIDLRTQLLEAPIFRETMTPNWLVEHGNNVSALFFLSFSPISHHMSRVPDDGRWMMKAVTQIWCMTNTIIVARHAARCYVTICISSTQAAVRMAWSQCVTTSCWLDADTLCEPWHCPLTGCTAGATGGVWGSSTVPLTERGPWKLLVDPLVCFRHYGGDKINHEWAVLSWWGGGSLRGALCDVTLSQTCCSPGA